jgi:hypothetical protein
MAPSEAAKAGPCSHAAADPQMITKLSDSWCSDTANPEAAQNDLGWSPADRRLANGGLGKCEMALLDCTPIVCDIGWYARLRALGVHCATGLHFDSVVFAPRGQFDFARDLRDASGAVVALIIPTFDERGELDDLVASDLDTGVLAGWLGRSAMLGAEMILAPRLGEPLRVVSDVRIWLGANREALVILDWQKAASQLEGVTLEVGRIKFGQELRQRLARPAPPIVVRVNARAAA